MTRIRNRFFGVLAVITAAGFIGGSTNQPALLAYSVNGAAQKEIKEEDMEAFHKISVRSDTGSLAIREGDSYSFTVSEDFTDEVTYNVKNDTLTVVTKNPTPLLPVKNKGKMTITVPSGSSLKEVEVNLAMGGVELDSLSVDEIELALAMGSVTALHCSLDETEAKADMGSITFEDCQGSSLDAAADMGSIQLDAVDIDEIEAESDMGSIRIQHKTSAADLTLDLKTGMGSVTVDGKKCGGSYSQKGSSGRKIEAETSMGSIEIN